MKRSKLKTKISMVCMVREWVRTQKSANELTWCIDIDDMKQPWQLTPQQNSLTIKTHEILMRRQGKEKWNGVGFFFGISRDVFALNFRWLSYWMLFHWIGNDVGSLLNSKIAISIIRLSVLKQKKRYYKLTGWWVCVVNILMSVNAIFDRSKSLKFLFLVEIWIMTIVTSNQSKWKVKNPI